MLSCKRLELSGSGPQIRLRLSLDTGETCPTSLFLVSKLREIKFFFNLVWLTYGIDVSLLISQTQTYAIRIRCQITDIIVRY